MIKKIKRLILSGLAALVLAIPTYSMAGDTLQRVIDFKVLRVGMSGNQPPMTMISSDGDEGKARNPGYAFWRADGGTGERQN